MLQAGYNMDLITMDDLTNDESISLLEDAMKLMPVARGLTHLPSWKERSLGTYSSKTQLGQGYHLKPQ